MGYPSIGNPCTIHHHSVSSVTNKCANVADGVLSHRAYEVRRRLVLARWGLVRIPMGHLVRMVIFLNQSQVTDLLVYVNS